MLLFTCSDDWLKIRKLRKKQHKKEAQITKWNSLFSIFVSIFVFKTIEFKPSCTAILNGTCQITVNIVIITFSEEYANSIFICYPF